jgi:uncharacterized protein with PIN domain
MNHASFRFYASLNDFLHPNDAHQQVRYAFWGNPAIKDAIEAIGPPHPEVELILVNGRSASFGYALQDGDHASVFPRFHRMKIDSISKVRPATVERWRFVLDSHLGQLARYLRMLGFDCLYDNAADDHALAHLSRLEQRVLLTRDRGLLKRSEVRYGYCVRADQPRRQLVEIVARFELIDSMAPFTRCMCCNVVLEDVTVDAVKQYVPERILQSQDRFRGCTHCGRIYWRGSHYARMQALIAAVVAQLEGRGKLVR